MGCGFPLAAATAAAIEIVEAVDGAVVEAVLLVDDDRSRVVAVVEVWGRLLFAAAAAAAGGEAPLPASPVAAAVAVAVGVAMRREFGLSAAIVAAAAAEGSCCCCAPSFLLPSLAASASRRSTPNTDTRCQEGLSTSRHPSVVSCFPSMLTRTHTASATNDFFSSARFLLRWRAWHTRTSHCCRRCGIFFPSAPCSLFGEPNQDSKQCVTQRQSVKHTVLRPPEEQTEQQSTEHAKTLPGSEINYSSKLSLLRLLYSYVLGTILLLRAVHCARNAPWMFFQNTHHTFLINPVYRPPIPKKKKKRK